MRTKGAKKRAAMQGGFTMVELLTSIAVLSLVMGVVVSGITTLQQRSHVEAAKVDLTQEVRQFQDQIVSDIHQAGFPGLKVFDPSNPAVLLGTPNVCDAFKTSVACGLVSATPTALQFEGDVDGSGTVSEVFIQLSPLNGPCPCTIQRGAETKAVWQATGQPPIYYTEVNNVMNTTIFNGYDNAGNSVALTGPVPAGTNLAAIEVTLNVRPTQQDVAGMYPTITMSTAVKIHNFH